MANEGYPAGGGSSLSASAILARLIGATTLAAGALLYGAGTSTLSTLPIGAANTVLTSTGAAPQWSTSLALTGTVASKQTAAAGISLDHNSATGNFTMRLSPANLTANRRMTLGDADLSITGGGTLALGGFTLTVPATGTVGLLAVANTWTAANVFSNTVQLDTSSNGLTVSKTTGTTVTISSTLAATATNNASVILSGGIGIAKEFWAGARSRIAVNGDSAQLGIQRTGTSSGLIYWGATGDRDAANTFDRATVYGTGLGRRIEFTIYDAANPTVEAVGSGVTGLTFNNSLTLTTGTKTADAPAITATQTWNNVATTFTGWLLNVTDTTSAAASVLAEFQIGSARRFAVEKTGIMHVKAASGVTAEFNLNGNGTGPTTGLTIQHDSASDTYIFQRSNRAMYFGTNNTTRGAISAAGDWSIGASSGTGKLDIIQGTITTAVPVLSGSSTWNAGGVTFTGVKLNVTDTASAAASLLLDLQVGGSSKASIGKSGALTLTGGTVTTSSPLLDITQTWNAGGVTFTGLKFNVTNTASAAGSLLLDLQVGGISSFSVGVGGRVISISNTSATSSAVVGFETRMRSTGTPSAGFGSYWGMYLESSTTDDMNALDITSTWVDATHASRKARTTLAVYDTASRECLRLEASGSAAMIGFLGATAIARPSSTGETGGFTAGAGTAMNSASTSTGNTGSTAYTFGDVVKHLKNLGLLTS